MQGIEFKKYYLLAAIDIVNSTIIYFLAIRGYISFFRLRMTGGFSKLRKVNTESRICYILSDCSIIGIRKPPNNSFMDCNVF